jgi:hypothetical protein
VKIERLLQTFWRRMLDFRPLLKEKSEIHDGSRYHGMAAGMAPDPSGDGSGIQAVTVVPFPGALEIFTM